MVQNQFGMALLCNRVKTVNGIVIAASEIISFDQSNAIIITMYNKNMGFYFNFLIAENYAKKWDIQVNLCYKFMNLKVGCLEMVSGKKIILLKTTLESSSLKIRKHMIEAFIIPATCIDLISTQSALESSCMKFGKKYAFVSYEGTVTNIKHSYGAYELDHKVMLYITYNVMQAKMPWFKEGSKLFISNAHFLNIKGKYHLVCCGLSSVKILFPVTYQVENNFEPSFILKSCLNIFDLLWIKNLIECLHRKFCSLLPNDVISFENNTELLQKLFSFFGYSNDSSTSSKYFSIIHEFCSYPHTCLPFFDSQICKISDILDISDILTETKRKISWIEISKQWKYWKAVDCSMVLVGLLYLSDRGYLLIEDNSGCFPILLAEECTDCSHGESILLHFKTCNTVLMVIIQDYCIIYESVKFQNTTQDNIVYIKTSSCCIFNLMSFEQIQNQTSLPQDFQQHLMNEERSISKSEKNSTLSLTPYMSSEKNIVSTFEQDFLVLSKLWTLNSKHQKCYKVLLLHVPKTLESVSDINFSEDNSFDFYETEDDYEFADLVNKLDSLYLDNVPKLLSLNFEKEHMANILFPGHIYSVDTTTILQKEFFNKRTQNNINLSMTMKANAKIHHKSSCTGKFVDSTYYKCYGVQEILMKKEIPRNSFIKAVLVDKVLKEDLRNIKHCKANGKQELVLCLLLRDVDSVDTIFAYVSSFPSTAIGLLPGILLELYGFQCVCSQKGYLYLKPLSEFGIETRHPVKQFWSETNKKEFYEDKVYLSFCTLQKLMKNLCFIVKIVSAELSLVCVKCESNHSHHCSCSSAYNMKACASAIIDDGRMQLMCHFHNNEVRKVLALDTREWRALKLFVEQTHKPLKFNDKMSLKDIAYLPMVNQVFCTYCLSKASCRQMLIEYYVLPSTVPTLEAFYYAWCVRLCDISVKDSLLEYYFKLKKL